MFTSKPTKNLPYSLRIKPMLVAMSPGDVIRIPAEKTRRMQVWTAVNRLNKAAGWKEYEYSPVINASGKKYFRIRRHTEQEARLDWVDTLIREAQSDAIVQVNQSPNNDPSDDQ